MVVSVRHRCPCHPSLPNNFTCLSTSKHGYTSASCPTGNMGILALPWYKVGRNNFELGVGIVQKDWGSVLKTSCGWALTIQMHNLLSASKSLRCSLGIYYARSWRGQYRNDLMHLSGRKKWKLLAPQFTPLLMDRFGREMAPSFDIENADLRFPNLAQAASLAIELEQVT